jgi:hypothetical protein
MARKTPGSRKGWEGSNRALVQAFEAMLRRHGPSGVGSNGVTR